MIIMISVLTRNWEGIKLWKHLMTRCDLMDVGETSLGLSWDSFLVDHHHHGDCCTTTSTDDWTSYLATQQATLEDS